MGNLAFQLAAFHAVRFNYRIYNNKTLSSMTSPFDLPEPPTDLSDFRRYLDEQYDVIVKSGCLPVIHGAAIGMVAYGHLEAIDKLLDTIPFGAPTGVGRALWAAENLYLMIPFPRTMSAVRDTEAVRAWVKENANKICWDEDKEEYELLE